MPILIVYGLPCTGKSNLIKNLPEFDNIAVDEIIRLNFSNPQISDFVNSSEEMMQHILTEVKNINHSKIVIEMGCLIPKRSFLQLEEGLVNHGYEFNNIILTAEHEEIIRRIKNRNQEIDNGKSDSIKIEGPDYLSRFTKLFDHNQPDNPIIIDTTQKSSRDVVSTIFSH